MIRTPTRIRGSPAPSSRSGGGRRLRRLPADAGPPRHRDGRADRKRTHMSDDDDWVGEPPEGRHTRDQAKPDFWRNQWQAIVATSILGVLVIVVVIIALL